MGLGVKSFLFFAKTVFCIFDGFDSVANICAFEAVLTHEFHRQSSVRHGFIFRGCERLLLRFNVFFSCVFVRGAGFYSFKNWYCHRVPSCFSSLRVGSVPSFFSSLWARTGFYEFRLPSFSQNLDRDLLCFLFSRVKRPYLPLSESFFPRRRQFSMACERPFPT